MELWPYGYSDMSKRLVTINIANVGINSEQADRCDYVYTIDEPSPLFGSPIHFTGILKRYDRKATAVDILGAVIKDYYNGSTQLSISDELIAERLRDKTLKTG
jgi:hypothetical protein